MEKYYSLHNLVTIKSDVGLPIPNYFSCPPVPKPDLTVRQCNFDHDVPRSSKKKRKDYSVWQEEGTLFIDYESLDLKISLSNLEGDTEIQVSDGFVTRSKKHLNTLVGLIIQLKLLEKNCTFLHSGCLTYDGGAILIPAMGSTGKTFTTLSLIDGKKRLFMSDDLSIISNGGDVYSYPGKIGTGPYVLENNAVPELSVKPLFSSKLARIPLISLIFGKFPWLYKSKNLEMPVHLTTDKSTCSYLFLIVGGSENKAFPISTSHAIVQSMNQHLDTHNLLGSFILNYYAYFFGYDLVQKIEQMREILISGLSSTQCFEIKSNELSSYPTIVLQTIAEN
ncbi:MAG: hypothetical protein MK159_02110 [Halobacteriales archaeon]|nr:hypothetical protein [Halobacteriales archaeon]